MTPAERAAAIASQLARYDQLEQHLREIIDAPHYRIRRGAIVLDSDGNPVPDPRPARKAQKLLDAFRRDHARLAGLPRPPRERTGPG